MARRLEGKVAVVTGGSRGIGEAIAEAFAQEGARVVIAARRTEGLNAVRDRIEAKHPGACRAWPCHVGDPEAVRKLIDLAEAEFGAVNVLVNNAATNPYFGPMLDVPMGAWDKTFEVNLKGYFEPTRLVCRRLMERGEPGAIVNVASILGLSASPLQGVYGMTKAAVISLTKTLAVELGKAGIRVNAIAPGVVETRLASALTGSPELLRFFTDRAALGRIAQPREIAGAAVYLASDESGFVTGQTIAVDAGYSIA